MQLGTRSNLVAVLMLFSICLSAQAKTDSLPFLCINSVIVDGTDLDFLPSSVSDTMYCEKGEALGVDELCYIFNDDIEVTIAKQGSLVAVANMSISCESCLSFSTGEGVSIGQSVEDLLEEISWASVVYKKQPQPGAPLDPDNIISIYISFSKESSFIDFYREGGLIVRFEKGFVSRFQAVYYLEQ